MASTIKGLSLEDELNLYLTANKLKPAAFLDYSSQLLSLNNCPGWRNVSPNEYQDIRFEGDTADQFEDLIKQQGLAYNREKVDAFQLRNSTTGDVIFSNEFVPFSVGKDEESLRQLRTANTYHETGLALGYPNDVVKRWCDDEAKGIPSAMEYRKGLARAKGMGSEPPTWLAYISFVPVGLDLLAGKIPRSSEEVGARYQDFVREHNPTLAQRVEHYFATKPMPHGW